MTRERPPHHGPTRSRVLRGRPAARLTAAAILLGLVLTGCAAGGTGSGQADAATSAPTATAADAGPALPTTTAPPPDGITVTIDQQRLDIPLDMMSIQVHNHSGHSLHIVAATYTDARFATPLEWTGDTTVPSDIQRDLRVPIPEPDCGAAADAPAPSVEVPYLVDDAVAGGQYVPTDPFDFVPLRVAADCFAARVEQTADVALTGVTTRQADGGEVAELQITIDDHSADGFTLASVSSTVLFQPADGATGWTPAATVAAGEKRVVTLDAIPSRCDAHALAEDKVGTRFDAVVSVGDPAVTGTLTLVASDQQRSDLYGYFSARCGLN